MNADLLFSFPGGMSSESVYRHPPNSIKSPVFPALVTFAFKVCRAACAALPISQG